MPFANITYFIKGQQYSHMPFRYIHMPLFGAYTCPQIRLRACLNRLFSMFASWHKTIANFENPSRPTFLTITTFINTMEEDDEWNSFSDSNTRERETHAAPATISLLPPPEADYNMFNQLLAKANIFAKIQSYTITIQWTLKSKRGTGDFCKAFLICDCGGEY